MFHQITDHSTKVRLEIGQRVGLFIRDAETVAQKAATPITPRDKGDLSTHVKKTVEGNRGSIEWMQQYAAVQEAGIIGGKPIQNYTTPGTGPHFAQRAIEEMQSQTDIIARKVRLK